MSEKEILMTALVPICKYIRTLELNQKALIEHYTAYVAKTTNASQQDVLSQIEKIANLQRETTLGTKLEEIMGLFED